MMNMRVTEEAMAAMDLALTAHPDKSAMHNGSVPLQAPFELEVRSPARGLRLSGGPDKVLYPLTIYPSWI
jgi:hypothetical protein